MAAPHVAGLLLMGGVEEGELVKANSAGHADPFALAAKPTSISDANGDGLVDGADHYQIYDDGEAIAIANRRGRTYSDSSSSQWDGSDRNQQCHQRHHPLKPRWNCHSRCTGKDQHPSCNSAVKSLRSQQASIALHSKGLGA